MSRWITKPPHDDALLWVCHVLKEAPYCVTGREIIEAVRDENDDRGLAKIDWRRAAPQLAQGIGAACRTGQIIAKAKRPGFYEYDTVPREEWAYLRVEMEHCGTDQLEENRRFSKYRARHKNNRLLFPLHLPTSPTGKLVWPEDSVHWEMAVYSLTDAGEQAASRRPARLKNGPPAELRQAIDEALRQVGKPGAGGVHWEVFSKKVRELRGVKLGTKGYSARNIRGAVEHMAKSGQLKNPTD